MGRMPRIAGQNSLGNGFLAEAMVHNVDVCCWAKDAWPVAAQGQGGRLALTQPGQPPLRNC